MTVDTSPTTVDTRVWREPRPQSRRLSATARALATTAPSASRMRELTLR